MKTIIIIDDNVSFLNLIKNEIEKHYPCFNIKTFNDPLEAFKEFDKVFDLLIVDWEMSTIDGKKVIDHAEKAGIPFYKIIVVSSKTSEELHKHFKMGKVLSVINKSDPLQINALFMILENISYA
ncbi:MAG: response regulator [Proteobacteria bacterium]|nr:response regulator [Pseudomonadota bacterium]